MLQTLAQSEVVVVSVEADATISPLALIILLALSVAGIVGMWKVFEKAGQAGWKSIIPIYNAYVLLQIAGRPGWWLVLLLVPFVNIAVSLVVAMDMAKAFAKSSAFGFFGLWLFSFIGYLMLGFGDAEYKLDKQAETPATPAV